MIKLTNGNTIETIESDGVRRKGHQYTVVSIPRLYDRVFSNEFNSDVKYYSLDKAEPNGRWSPLFDINSESIIERSIIDENTWVIIKLGNEMRDDIRELLNKGEK